MNVYEFLGRLQGVRKAGAGYVARCPGHDDRHASLSIGSGDGGRVLLKCHAGCTPAEVAGALELQLSELFPERRRLPDPEAIYEYTDEHGTVLFEVLRYPGKQFRQRKPEGAGYNWKLQGVRRVPYRLPDLIAADPDDPVYIVEGEKDVHTLVAKGMVATTQAGGAGKWRREYNPFFMGRQVVIVPDNDEPGRQHAELVASQLASVAVRVRVVHLPGLAEKGDVTDWFTAGGTAERFRELVADTGQWEPHRAPAATKPKTERKQDGFVESARRAGGLIEAVKERAAGAIPFRIGFLRDIAIGMLDIEHVVLGAPTGAGKTTIAASVAKSESAAGGRVAYLALEAHENEIEQRLLFQEMARLAWERRVASFTELEQFTYASWCHGRCGDIVAAVRQDALIRFRNDCRGLRTLYRTGRFTRDDLVRFMKAVSGEVDLIILDHLHFIDDGDDDEVRAMKRTVKAASDCIQDMRTPVMAIAHLRKIDVRSKRLIPHIADFHGASDITKVATKVITVAPAWDHERQASYLAPTYMHVSKDRLVGEQNYTAVLGFDLRSSTYHRPYELGRLSPDGAKWEAVKAVDLPWWAENEARKLAAHGIAA